MTARPILKMGDPLLYKTARPVDPPGSTFWQQDLPALVQDMHDSLDEAGGIGLAAPQIGVDLRIVIISVPKLRMAKQSLVGPWQNGVPRTVVINPEITILDMTETQDWEACLSVPGLSGHVPRPSKIRLSGLTERGEPLEWVADGYHARVILHECDHLDGILYPQRLHSVKDLIFTSERSKQGVS